MGLLDDIAAGTYRPTADAAPPWPSGLFTRDLTTTARRVRGGDDWWVALRELLDEYALRPPEIRPAAIEARPPASGDARFDALFGATAEWLAGRDGFTRPDWCLAPDRFLAAWWVPFDRPSVVASALVSAPAAFRRRGIFIPARSLGRV